MVDDLTAQLAPSGVPFVPLGQLLTYEQPTKYLVASTNYNDKFTTPVLTAGQTFVLGRTDETEGIYPASPASPVIIFDDFTTAFKWVDFPFKAKSSAMKMLTPSDEPRVTLRYAFYAMQTIRYAPQDHARQWIGTYSGFRIPVPPVEVQHEIVRILDQFTLLEAELETELDARQRQYGYYRSHLVAEPQGFSTALPLGEIFEMRAGKHIPSSEISEVPTDEKPYPCFGGNGLRGYVSEYNYDRSVLLIGRQGALCGNVHRADGKIYATEHAVVVTPRLDVDMAWAYHKLAYMNLNQYKTKSAQPGLAVGKIKDLRIAYVPVAEQAHRTAVLDELDALMNDPSTGLPAEIAARRKQYAYYRDKLFAFEEAVT
nr:restriction endonuclease subunit S [Microbacterium thalassium]